MTKESDRLSNVAYIGIGGCGQNMLKAWQNKMSEHVLCIAVDRDERSFMRSDEFEHRILLTHVKSKAATAEYANSVQKEVQASMEENFTALDQLLDSRDTVILLAGLGGVIGTWGSQVICNYLIAMGKQVITVLVMPFSFERERIKVADIVLPAFDGNAHRVMCFNDYLIKHSPEHTSMSGAFDLMNQKAFELFNHF